jgi:hypothetical protein
MAQAQDEQGQAHPVAEEADHGGGECRTRQERQGQVDAARDQAFDHRDLYRVGRGELAGEVVVDAPGQARSGNEECPPAQA